MVLNLTKSEIEALIFALAIAAKKQEQVCQVRLKDLQKRLMAEIPKEVK